jgi:methylmalonyl-CoA mutase
MPLEDAARAIFFRFASDADQFLSIAKLRAIRKLWARVAEACGIVPPRAFVSAETAWRMMTRRDAHVNMLRTTMAAFSAAAGGADAITVLPFTAALGLPDDFARRIARNTQALLAEESHLAKVSDPAAGAGAVEDLTRQLCDAAWSLFQEFERAGGVAATLEAGLLQRKVAATRAAREKAIARRVDVLTGTSEFPNLGEAVPAVLDCPPPPRAIVPASVVRFMPLPPMRLSEPFEALRDRSDRSLAASGKRPQVFLALLGTIAESTPRTTFARGFFAAGGIEAIESEAAAGADAIARAFAASGAKMACLCSSDEVYAREAAATAAALKAAGAGTVYLAGRPGELEAALRNAGVDAFIYAGCDVLGSLEDAYARVGL